MRSNRSATDQRGAGAISITWIAQSSIAAIDATDMSRDSTDMGAPFRMPAFLVPGGTRIYSGSPGTKRARGSSDVGGVGHNGFCVGEAGVWRRRR